MWTEIRFILKDGTNRTFCRIKYGKRVTFHVCVTLTMNKFGKLIYNGELNVTILWMIQDKMTYSQRILNQLSKRMSWHKWNKLLDHWCYHHIEQDLHWHLMLNHLDQRLAYSQKIAWDASFDLTKGSFISMISLIACWSVVTTAIDLIGPWVLLDLVSLKLDRNPMILYHLFTVCPGFLQFEHITLLLFPIQ